MFYCMNLHEHISLVDYVEECFVCVEHADQSVIDVNEEEHVTGNDIIDVDKQNKKFGTRE